MSTTFGWFQPISLEDFYSWIDVTSSSFTAVAWVLIEFKPMRRAMRYKQSIREAIQMEFLISTPVN